jgi:hypothetical protein
VKHRHEGKEGFIDGLTECADRNPDGRTQYRMNIGIPTRRLVVEDDLSILIDDEDLVIMIRHKAAYRRSVTAQLHEVLANDRFIKSSHWRANMEIACSARMTGGSQHGCARQASALGIRFLMAFAVRFNAGIRRFTTQHTLPPGNWIATQQFLHANRNHQPGTSSAVHMPPI